MKKKLNLRCDSLPSNCLQVKIEKAEFNLTIIDFLSTRGQQKRGCFLYLNMSILLDILLSI